MMGSWLRNRKTGLLGLGRWRTGRLGCEDLLKSCFRSLELSIEGPRRRRRDLWFVAGIGPPRIAEGLGNRAVGDRLGTLARRMLLIRLYRFR